MKVIGFDFDGTLILSEDIKANLFDEIFREHYGLKSVKKFYPSLRGISRKDKIKKVFSHFLARSPSSRELHNIDFAFSKGYEYRMSTCPLVKCVSALKVIRKKFDFMFMLSLENQREVRELASHCGLNRYFDVILGGPKSKEQNLRFLMRKRKFHAKQALYVGDSKSDLALAKKLGMRSLIVKNNLSGIPAKYASLCDFK